MNSCDFIKRYKFWDTLAEKQRQLYIKTGDEVNQVMWGKCAAFADFWYNIAYSKEHIKKALPKLKHDLDRFDSYFII